MIIPGKKSHCSCFHGWMCLSYLEAHELTLMVQWNMPVSTGINISSSKLNVFPINYIKFMQYIMIIAELMYILG